MAHSDGPFYTSLHRFLIVSNLVDLLTAHRVHQGAAHTCTIAAWIVGTVPTADASPRSISVASNDVTHKVRASLSLASILRNMPIVPGLFAAYAVLPTKKKDHCGWRGNPSQKFAVWICLWSTFPSRSLAPSLSTQQMPFYSWPN